MRGSTVCGHRAKPPKHSGLPWDSFPRSNLLTVHINGDLLLHGSIHCHCFASILPVVKVFLHQIKHKMNLLAARTSYHFITVDPFKSLDIEIAETGDVGTLTNCDICIPFQPHSCIIAIVNTLDKVA